MARKVLTCLIVLILALSIIGCSAVKDTVIVGSKPFTEGFILGEIVALLIEENTDINVERKAGIAGGTSALHPAIISGEIDIYPEYTGTGWLFVLKQDPISDPDELYDMTKEMYESEYNLAWSGIYGFNNTYSLGIKKDKAKELKITTFSELAAVSENLVFGSEADFYERDDGFPALAETYGFDFKEEKEINIGLRYEAVGSDEVDVITVFTTDGSIKTYDIKTLIDDKNYFTSYHAATVTRMEVLDKHPELVLLLEKLTGAITDEEMIAMNYEVEVNKKDYEIVAKEFLQNKGFIE